MGLTHYIVEIRFRVKQPINCIGEISRNDTTFPFSRDALVDDPASHITYIFWIDDNRVLPPGGLAGGVKLDLAGAFYDISAWKGIASGVVYGKLMNTHCVIP